MNPMRGEKNEPNQNSPRNKNGEDGEKEQKKGGRLEGKGPDFYTSSKTEFFVKRSWKAYYLSVLEIKI